MFDGDAPETPTATELQADLARRELESRQQLEETKRQALAAGKEAFDLDTFDELYEAPNAKFERTMDRSERIRNWETQYYMWSGSSAQTIAEFAELKRYYDENWT